MGFRDDREALDAKVRSLEQELAATRAELVASTTRASEIEGEAERLRGTLRARGDRDTRMTSWTVGLLMGLVLGAGGTLFALVMVLGK